ncbi:hypothetical protein ACSTD8_18510 [Vibrio vulnificus]|uniref:hypothetical protein n=1 Tax=Vibrio vulnificus TaxID=672 RepID=UPI003EDA2C61
MKSLLFFIWAKYEPFWVRYQLKVNCDWGVLDKSLTYQTRVIVVPIGRKNREAMGTMSHKHLVAFSKKERIIRASKF